MLDVVVPRWTYSILIGYLYDFVVIVDFTYFIAQDKMSTPVKSSGSILRMNTPVTRHFWARRCGPARWKRYWQK
jgi:hypothetical protein